MTFITFIRRLETYLKLRAPGLIVFTLKGSRVDVIAGFFPDAKSEPPANDT